MEALQIAAVQLVSQVGEGAIEQNFVSVENLLQRARAAGATLAVLPENVLTFGQKHACDQLQQRRWLERFAAMAQAYNLWLVAGSLPLQDFSVAADGALIWRESAGLPFATCVVFNSQGTIAAVYRKVHLFNAQVNDAHGNYRESDFFQAGNSATIVDTPWGKMGIGICFDLRFAHFFQQLRRKGADFVVLPSAFTYTTGKAHWEILLRARAIENQFAVVGVNQGGVHDEKRKTWGDSMIVDAWGTVLARAGEKAAGNDPQLGEQLVMAQLDLSVQKALREQIPLGASSL